MNIKSAPVYSVEDFEEELIFLAQKVYWAHYTGENKIKGESKVWYSPQARTLYISEEKIEGELHAWDKMITAYEVFKNNTKDSKKLKEYASNNQQEEFDDYIESFVKLILKNSIYALWGEVIKADLDYNLHNQLLSGLYRAECVFVHLLCPKVMLDTLSDKCEVNEADIIEEILFTVLKMALNFAPITKSENKEHSHEDKL